MKKISLTLSLFLCFIACTNEQETPVITPNEPEEPEYNIRESIPLTENERGMVYAGNIFAYDVYDKIHEAKETPNIVISPLSISLAFSMLNNGAEGITKEEIQKVLGFEGYSASDINNYYKKMIEAAIKIDPWVVFETANSIWINNGFPILPEFTTVNQKAYDAEIRNEDFALPATLDKINNWSSEKTHGKVPKILNELNNDTKLILMNALYFLGKWTQPFDEKNTTKAPFTNANGNAVTVDMMSHDMILTSYRENDLLATIDFPYGNHAFYMQFLLPHENVPLEGITKDLQQATSGMTSILAEVSLKVPKFEINFETDLSEILEELGMESAFNPITANFSSVSNIPLFVSMAKQKAAITVNEKGSEAAAVTILGMEAAADLQEPQKKDFHLNRPFLFLIKELSTDAIFFMGEVTEL